MKIALAQLNFMIGDFEGNTLKILDAAGKACEQKADLAVFPELCVCGYPPRDFLEFSDFIRKSQDAVEMIAKNCKDIAVIVGAPSINPAEKGKPLYNSAFFLKDGKIHDIVHKTLLPNYDVFDEYRYFEPNRLPYHLIEYCGKKIAVTICEDLWNIADNPLYVRNPMDELAALGPDLVINIAASPFNYNQPAHRFDILSRNAKKYSLPVFYVNHIGGQTELLFDGGSKVVDAKGETTEQLKFFEEQITVIDTTELHPASGIRHPASGIQSAPPEGGETFPGNKAEMSAGGLIRSALTMGIRDYFSKMGFTKATLGLSGGIDSAVTLVLAVDALGKENVLPLLLPSKFSSEHSITDAIALCNNLGTGHRKISIDESFHAVESTLEPWFGGLPFNLAEENIQARLRAVILMAFSNKFGYILLNTSNKSEAAVGYGTLYGDMCGGLSVLGDLYKTQVYELAAEINREREIIPGNTLTKPPSAELRPGQKDSDSLPEYEILDKILFEYIEHHTGPDDLILKGFDESVVRKVLKLVNTSEHKRYQAPPILRVSPKAFGSGRRLPITGKYLS
jgi:NAD+ synthase (glutamine-hydrolysing)